MALSTGKFLNYFQESTAEKYLFADLGSLFVCLEYQLAAKRMKVMVRKACNLPKSDRLIGRPGNNQVYFRSLRGSVARSLAL